MGFFEIFLGFIENSEIRDFWDFLRFFGIFRDFLGFFEIFWDFWDFLGFFGIFLGFFGKVYEIFSSYLPLGFLYFKQYLTGKFFN